MMTPEQEQSILNAAQTLSWFTSYIEGVLGPKALVVNWDEAKSRFQWVQQILICSVEISRRVKRHDLN